jgi:hypothetical protein
MDLKSIVKNHSIENYSICRPYRAGGGEMVVSTHIMSLTGLVAKGQWVFDLKIGMDLK